MSEIEVVVHEKAVHAVLADPGYGAAVLHEARATVLATARAFAPKRSGAGAASMDASLKTEPDGSYVVHVSWDKTFYYMRFQDTGTVHVPALRFMERAAQQYGGTITPAGSSHTTGTTTRPRRRRPGHAHAARYVVVNPDGSAYAGTRAAARRASTLSRKATR